jgi:myo-inositol-1(or 4)-monophosphatase
VPESDAELAVRSAVAGADVVRSFFGGPLERIAKESGDFATEADVAAERAIIAVLRGARPEDRITGEELGDVGSPASARSWLVDPLCGTANFAARTPLVAVNVALRVGEGIAAAAVADPFSGEVFWTDGEVARVRAAGLDVPLAPDAASRLVDVNVDPPFLNRGRFLAARLLHDRAFGEAFGARVLSTSLALTWVAAGRRAAYVTDGDVRDSVHFTAGIALCRAAGCVVTGLTGQPLHDGAQGLVAASDVATHRTLIRMITGQADPRGWPADVDQ